MAIYWRLCAACSVPGTQAASYWIVRIRFTYTCHSGIVATKLHAALVGTKSALPLAVIVG